MGSMQQRYMGQSRKKNGKETNEQVNTINSEKKKTLKINMNICNVGFVKQICMKQSSFGSLGNDFNNDISRVIPRIDRVA